MKLHIAVYITLYVWTSIVKRNKIKPSGGSTVSEKVPKSLRFLQKSNLRIPLTGICTLF